MRESLAGRSRWGPRAEERSSREKNSYGILRSRFGANWTRPLAMDRLAFQASLRGAQPGPFKALSPPRDPMRVLIPIVFLLLAAWMLVGAPDARPELVATPPVDAAAIDPANVRPIMHDPASIRIGGFEQRCNDCHRLFESEPETPPKTFQHQDIHLDHGMNDRCLNCHDLENRERLRLHGSQTVGFDQVQELCAKCHGPTYRDWELGIHGRTNGYWDETRGERKRLVCTQCHDPHAPAFEPIIPLPGPNTLRMGRVLRSAEHSSDEDHGPLARGMRASTENSAHTLSSGEESSHE